ncbi:nuclear transport factor 2 family protein [Streptomyces sp. XM4193]|uniref:nuclear transport factor 2 family protein n=1 Tax=Streptomyces sp. XM4193 TaxID=2929782 RepID=UPI001FFBE827|nr:nuclear transport factor 2 family protein [Streptomyces sp. XM4193]MCK1795035.1 nuclear transport factor 2 family protein [Streptomyces sp. XM4193]
MSTLADRIELIELMGRYADIADLKDFTRRPYLVHSDSVTLDFSSVVDMPPMTVPLDEYVQALGQAFAPFAATHHCVTGHVVEIDGDRATIHAHVRAEHWVPEERAEGGPDRWLVVGFYDNEAVRTPHGWRLSSVKLTATHQENAHLAAPAPTT